MIDWVTSILMILGAAFILLASIGIVRMPDLYTRLQTASKAPTLGCSLILCGMATHFQTVEVVTIAIVTAAFIVLTAPVAGHMIARAAYFVGVPLWSGTVIDELGRGEDRTREESGNGAGKPTGKKRVGS